MKHSASSILAILALVTCSVGLHAQTTSITTQWDVQLTVDASKAKQHPTAAKAAESTLKMLGGAVSVATMTDRLTLSGGRYTLSSSAQANLMIASFLPNRTATRTSTGTSAGQYLMSQQFTEERTKGNERKVLIDYITKTAHYYKAGQATKQENVLYRTADTATLPYIFYKKALPTSLTAIAATDGTTTRIFKLIPSLDTVTLGNQAIPAIKLTRRLDNPEDAGLMLWIRKSDGFPLSIRLDLNAKYGAVLEQKLMELPKGF